LQYALRDYQQDAANAAVRELKSDKGKPFMLVLATGAGKSLVIAEICHQLDAPVLILQPGKEILEQNFKKLKSYGITDIAMYSASMKSRKIAKYTYATIQSIYRTPELFTHFKYVILDECHGLNPKNKDGMLTSFLNAIGCTNVCGLTATPYRLSQKYFWENGQQFYTSHLKMLNRIHPFFFKSILYKVETQDLIDRGYLSPILYRADREVDMLDLQVNSTGADFDSGALEAFWDDNRLKKMARIIQRIDEKCQRNLVFCSSIRQAQRAQELLLAMNIDSYVITGKTPLVERESMVEAFRAGKVKHMLNVGVFTTGFDVPELDCVVLAKPTMSLALYYQMVGRGVRLDPARPDKKLRVYDLAGVVAKLGRVESIRVVKEADGWKDMVVSEAGVMTEVPLFKFLVKKKMFTKKEEQ
jgi:DNA repair protein RadD